ncbi:MAG TPA: winged helix-turn-helix domain-containing protein [Taishania sp.]|nr:winged helix-turn-helix domain-containing protein [Taishania sp.]
MGATKYEAYTERQIQFANFFKSIAHPARFAAIESLIEAGGDELTFDEIFKNINLAQSTKSVHLKQLIEAGIIKTKLTKNRNKSCLKYRLNKTAFEFLEKLINHINDKVDLNENERLSALKGFYQNNINLYRLNLFKLSPNTYQINSSESN